MDDPAATYQATYRGTFHTHRGGVSVDDAARELGVSPSTIRRWVKSGRLTSERVSRPQGYVVLVQLPGDVAPANGGESPDQQLPTAAPGQVSTAPTIAARGEIERAEQMAAYMAAVTAPLVEQIRVQAETIGRLQAELEQVRADQTVDPTVRQPTPQRCWWQRLLLS